MGFAMYSVSEKFNQRGVEMKVRLEITRSGKEIVFLGGFALQQGDFSIAWELCGYLGLEKFEVVDRTKGIPHRYVVSLVKAED